jgi:hypothetical protein
MMRHVCVLVVCITLGSAASARPNPVVEWNAVAGSAALASCLAPVDNPLHESRMYAMMHIAVHDALNAIDRRFRPYAFDHAARPWASVDAAVAAAARNVLVTLIGAIPFPFPPACIDAGRAVVEAAYAAAIDEIPDGEAKSAGLRIGRAAATAILRLRKNDGSNTPLLDFDYPQGSEPGEYRFTPGSNFVFAPGWAEVTPFALHHASQFRPGPPYAIRSRKYARDLDEVKRLGSDGISAPSIRTSEETEIARFWVESSPLQWNRIARAAAADRGLDPWEHARLFGLLNIAMADGYIASFAAKTRYNFWRPVTAIQNADSDGNPETLGDPDWLPLVPTPPITEHDSAHAVEGAAAAEVMRRVFRSDAVAFSTCSLTLPAGSRCGEPGQVLRSYTSLSHAAAENGRSRILVGFHFRHAVEDGIDHGRRIARRAVARLLRPVH